MSAIRDFILRRLLTPDQLAVVRALDAPERYLPDPALTKDEATAWGSVLTSPIGIKIDTAMINWTQQEAQRAITQPDVVRAAGFALGCRASWQMAKTLSRLAAANSDQPEDEAPTAAETLAHMQP